HLAQCRVRLLRRLGVNANAHSAFLRTPLQRRRLRLGADLLTPFPNQLRKRRHGSPSIEQGFTSLPASANAETRSVSACLRKKSSCVKQKTAQGAEIAFATRSSIDAANNIPPVVSGPVQWAKLVWPERLTL